MLDNALHELQIEINTLKYAVRKKEDGIEFIFVLQLTKEDFDSFRKTDELGMSVAIVDERLVFQLHINLNGGTVYFADISSSSMISKKIRSALNVLIKQKYLPVYIIDKSGRKFFGELDFLEEDKIEVKKFIKKYNSSGEMVIIRKLKISSDLKKIINDFF